MTGEKQTAYTGSETYPVSDLVSAAGRSEVEEYMSEEELLQFSVQTGFANAAVVNTDDIVFNSAFRPLCAENICGKYGANYACPPACGTVEEMRRRVLCYRRALVLQSVWKIDNPFDDGQIKPAKRQHNAWTRQVAARAGGPGLMAGASGCDLCSPCLMVRGKPCCFPELRFSCMSAYCIFVKDLADHCGMDYDCGKGMIAFFSIYCFQERDG